MVDLEADGLGRLIREGLNKFLPIVLIYHASCPLTRNRNEVLGIYRFYPGFGIAVVYHALYKSRVGSYNRP